MQVHGVLGRLKSAWAKCARALDKLSEDTDLAPGEIAGVAKVVADTTKMFLDLGERLGVDTREEPHVVALRAHRDRLAAFVAGYRAGSRTPRDAAQAALSAYLGQLREMRQEIDAGTSAAPMPSHRPWRTND